MTGGNGLHGMDRRLSMEVTFLRSAFQERQYPPPDRPEIAIAGRSNVGKSTLINVLVNRKGIARTSARPGRTQALNFFLVENRFYLVDLPGYGYARVPLAVKKSWGKMVETYLRKRPNLKAVVVILDIRRDPSHGDKDLLNWLKTYKVAVILVLTKSDKLSKSQNKMMIQRIGGQLTGLFAEEPVLFSSKTKVGKEEIWGRITDFTGS
jgi:GTP-binding protein